MIRYLVVLSLLTSGWGAAQGQKVLLLNVQKGELPNDASAQVALTTEFPEKQGGVSLKVAFGKGAFGQYNPKLKDWTGLRYLRLFAHNPQDKPVALYLAVRDKDTANYDTRADLSFTLQPGLNNVSLDLSTLKRNNDPKPLDLASIRQWFIAAQAEAPDQVLYFGDIVLESEAGGAQPAAAGAEAPPATAPAEATQALKRIILEGRIRIEIDSVTIQDLVAAGLAPGGPAATPGPAATASSPGGPQKLVLLDTFSGQVPNDGPARFSLSEDHAQELGGKSVKVTYTSKEEAFGMGAWSAGTRFVGNWEGYNVLRFEAFNATDKLLGCYLGIRDQNPGYENRADLPFRLAPGLNKVELAIGAIVTNAGKQLDKTDIRHWFIPCDQEATVYFANFRLETK